MRLDILLLIATSSLSAFACHGPGASKSDATIHEISERHGPYTSELTSDGFDQEPLSIKYECIDGRAVFGGDMLINASCALTRGFGISATYLRWPDATMPYVFDDGYAESARAEVLAAMRDWEKGTGLRFVERTDEADYVRIEKSLEATRCWSYVGRTGGVQPMALVEGGGCALHEIGHALGLMHEHQRPDRDEHIKVLYENIEASMREWYEPVQGYQPYGPYDLQSVMHYPSGWGDKPFMVTLDGKSFDSAYSLSKQDTATMLEIYRGIALPTPDDEMVALAEETLLAVQAKLEGCSLQLEAHGTPDERGMMQVEVRATAADGTVELAGFQTIRKLTAAVNARIMLAYVPKHALKGCKRL